MQRAQKVAQKHNIHLVAITILTSFDEEDVRGNSISDSIDTTVLKLAKKAYSAGIKYIVCSPFEAQSIKKELPECITMTPGVTSENQNKNNQKRTMLYSTALQGVSDYVIMGRGLGLI